MKKILVGLILFVLMIVPFGAVQSGQPFHDEGASCLIDPCDCCFDNVDIQIGEFNYNKDNYSDAAWWDITLTPTKNGRPVNKAVAFEAYVYSSRYDYIYGRDAFYLDETVFDNVYLSGIRTYDNEPALYKVIWRPGLDYEFKIHGFNYEDIIHLMIITSGGCIIQSDPMVFDFGSPPEPN